MPGGERSSNVTHIGEEEKTEPEEYGENAHESRIATDTGR